MSLFDDIEILIATGSDEAILSDEQLDEEERMHLAAIAASDISPWGTEPSEPLKILSLIRSLFG